MAKTDKSVCTPVLLILFNRPEAVASVMAVLRQVRPRRLYLAADGPRHDKPMDGDLCMRSREVALDVDWPCEVYKLFRDVNLGCRTAPSQAIDWFFNKEECGIILEDDCVPHPDFFTYCEWGLEEYRDDKTVWQLNGSNLLAPCKLFRGRTTSFVSLAQVWGWATWRDRWEHYVNDPDALESASIHRWRNWNLSLIARTIKFGHIFELKKGLETWDYQWQITILNHHGLVVSPVSNLISNIGTGTSATHTIEDSRANAPTESFHPPVVGSTPKLNKSLNRYYEKRMGLRSRRNFVRAWILSCLVNKSRWRSR